MSDLKEMDLKEKIGQLLMIGFKGKSLDRETKDFIQGFHIGGVILFDHNLSSASQIRSLCKELKKLNKIPPLISVDEEGGRVSRLKRIISKAPPAGALGKIGSVELVRSSFKNTARELKLLNINMNMAPVLDINTNPKNPVIGDRAFGKGHKMVTKMGLAAMKALYDEGIIAVAKHFPGHGDTSKDSHLALPKLNHNLNRLRRVELKPFIAAIRHSVDAIMTAHILYKGIDPNCPATLSRRIIHDLLRKELGFNRVVISDDLTMKGITGEYRIDDAAVLAKNAGVDILLVCHHRKDQARVYERLIKSVEKKEISQSVIDQSVKRILKLKEKYLKR